MRIRTLIAFTLLLAATALSSSAQSGASITVKTDNVSRKLVESWVNAYKTVCPEVTVTIVSNSEEANLILGTTSPDGDVADKSYTTTAVGRLAILPVTSTENPLLSEIENKQWNVKSLRKLFFQTQDQIIDGEDKDSKKDRLGEQLTVISGNNRTSAAQLFAQHFGLTKADLRGKRIAGDDQYLINAVQKEKQAVTFNTLTYLYDLSTRSLKPGIALIPLNVKKEQAEAFSSGNLDKTLSLLEVSKVNEVPVKNISFRYQVFNSDINRFLAWVVSDGQQYNHGAGFLRLSTDDARQQLRLLAER